MRIMRRFLCTSRVLRQVEHGRFGRIAAEMDQRKLEYNMATHVDPEVIKSNHTRLGNFPVQYYWHSEALKVGDLVESRRGGLSVILTPPDEEDLINICTASGSLYAVKRRDLALRLGNFASPDLLQNCVRTVSIGKDEQQVVAGLVRHEVCGSMRQFLRKCYLTTNQIRPELESWLDSKHARNIPLFELASRVQAGGNQTHGEFPPEFDLQVKGHVLYSVYKLLTTVFYNKALVDDRASLVTILGGEKKASSMHRFAISDYSANDAKLQSRAIAQLRRKKEYKTETLDSATAMMEISKELASYHGPYYSKQKYDFLRTSEPSLATSEAEKQDVAKSRSLFDRPVYCIDADDAGEIDDGMSVEQVSANKFKFAVHIADPVSALRGLGVNSLKAPFEQTTTAYLPAGALPIFDKQFTQKFGLVPGEARRCLSFHFECDLEAGTANLTHLEPQLASNVVKITYDQADEHLANKTHPDLESLNKIASLLRKKRQGNGAVWISIPGSRVWFDNDQVCIEPEKPSEAKKLVEEMMVMANHSVAKYMKRQKIPTIYRSQSVHFDMPNLESTNGELTISDSFSLLRQMNSASLVLEPTPHQSLGLSNYLQCTSPLRRFQDLVVHWQLHSRLAGLSEFSETQLGAMACRIEALQIVINQAQRDSKKFWILRKIQQDHQQFTDLNFECAITRELRNGQLYVHCKNFGIEAEVEGVSPHQAFTVGAIINCGLEKVNPDTLTLKLNFKTMA